MYKELKALFGGRKPSVRKFTLALQTVPSEEQSRYYKAAYDAAFTEWDTLPQSYQTFLRDLLMHDKQRTQGTASYRHLAFVLLLLFPYTETVDYLSDKLRLERLTTDDLCELLDRMRLDNEPGRL